MLCQIIWLRLLVYETDEGRFGANGVYSLDNNNILRALDADDWEGVRYLRMLERMRRKWD